MGGFHSLFLSLLYVRNLAHFKTEIGRVMIPKAALVSQRGLFSIHFLLSAPVRRDGRDLWSCFWWFSLIMSHGTISEKKKSIPLVQWLNKQRVFLESEGDHSSLRNWPAVWWCIYLMAAGNNQQSRSNKSFSCFSLTLHITHSFASVCVPYACSSSRSPCRLFLKG